MSLLLSWETPASFYDALKTPSTATLWRRYGADLPRQKIAEGLGWGFYEDVGSSDPTTIYNVEFFTPDGQSAPYCVADRDIRRWRRPGDSCKVEFAFVRSDSAPWSGRRVKLFDLTTAGWMRDIYTGLDGKAHVVLQWGRTLRLELEGDREALEFVVPKEHYLAYGELYRAGTARPFDERCLR